MDTPTRIFVMCQGEQRRMKGVIEYPKHMIPFNGEYLLARTLRMVAPLAYWTTVVGTGALHDAVLTGTHVDLLKLADPGKCILDGLRQVLDYSTNERMVVLLGDVVWSKTALTKVLNRPGTFFAGTAILDSANGELFAFAYEGRREAKMILNRLGCPCWESEQHTDEMQPGHLRHLWNAAKNDPSVSYLTIDDWTDDIDEPGDLEKLPQLEALALAEVGA